MTQDRQSGSLRDRKREVEDARKQKVREKVGGRWKKGRKRWADEITPAGLLALAAGV